MKGQNFLKVTGILMIIAAVLSILVGVVIGGIGALAAGLGAGSGLTVSYFLALIPDPCRRDLRADRGH